jgi:hypothetical protein
MSARHTERPAMSSETELTRRIDAIKAQIAKLGELRPGTLSEQYNTCGTPNCRCKADPPQRHGPRYQLSYTRHRRGHTESVRPEHLDDVRTQLATYRRLQALIDEWVDACIALDRLRRAGAPAATS